MEYNRSRESLGCRAGLLRPDEAAQQEVLVNAVTELLWRCGAGQQAVLAVPGAKPVIDPTPLLVIVCYNISLQIGVTAAV